MVKTSVIIDYAIVLQLVLGIAFLIFFHSRFEGIVVYLSLMLFFSYWIIKIIFNKQFKERVWKN